MTNKDKILFLKLFTQELIINSKKPAIEKPAEQPAKEIHVLPPILPHSQILQEMTKLKEQESKKRIEKPAENFLPRIVPEVAQPTQIFPRPIQRIQPIHPIKPLPKIQRPSNLTIRPTRLTRRFTRPISAPPSEMSAPPVTETRAEPDLGKLNILLKDKAITIIECLGPEKLILVKKANRVNFTKIKLSEDDIKKIIENFSKSARIPITGGVFKAITGDLRISAVISEFVGSRFILYRTTPYSLIENKP